MNDGVIEEEEITTEYKLFKYVENLTAFTQAEHDNRYLAATQGMEVDEEEDTLEEKIQRFHEERDLQFEQDLQKAGMPDLESATEKIRGIVPGYQFSYNEPTVAAAHKELHENAKAAYREHYVGMYTSNVTVNTNWTYNASTPALLHYADHVLNERESIARLNEISMMSHEDIDKNEERLLQLHNDLRVKVCEDALKNRESMMESLKADNVTPAKMVEHWTETAARMEVYSHLGEYMEDSGKYTPEQIAEATASVEPMVKIFNVMESRMKLMASPIGARMDVGQFEKLSRAQQTDVAKLFPEDVRDFLSENIGDINQLKKDAAKAQLVDHFKTKDPTTFYFTDVDGNPIGNGEDQFDALVNGNKPVLCCPFGHEPELIQPDGTSGRLLCGEEAINGTSTVSRISAVPKKPGAFAMWWDGLMENLGLNFLRVQSCIDYKRALFKEGQLEEANVSLDETQKMLRDEPDKVRAGKERFLEQFPQIDPQELVPDQPAEDRQKTVTDPFAEKLRSTNLPENQKENLNILKTFVKEERERLAEALETAGDDPAMKRTVYGKALSCFVIENRLRMGVDEMAKGQSSELTQDLQNLLEQVGTGDPVAKYNKIYYDNEIMDEFFDSLTAEQGKALCSAKVMNHETRDLLARGVNFGKEKLEALGQEVSNELELTNSNVKQEEANFIGK